MNTRILRMIDRTPIKTPRGLWKHPVWRVAGLGQMQPVLFSIEHGCVTLRIEDAAERHGNVAPCWAALPLPRHKARAKGLFAHLETCKINGTRSAASQAWESAQ